MSGIGNGTTRLAVEEVHPRIVERVLEMASTQEPTPTTYSQTSTPTLTSPKPQRNLSFISSIGGTFTAIAMLLSVRLLLLMSVVGAFVLAYVAIPTQNTYSLWVLGIFCLFTLPVLTYLDIQTRRRD